MYRILVTTILVTLFLFSCSEEPELTSSTLQPHDVPDEIITKLEAAGFVTTEGLSKAEGGYVVEGDIFLTEEQIDELINHDDHLPNEEHYRSTNLVTVGNVRVLRVFMDPIFNNFMQNAFDAALARYNAVGLRLQFQRWGDAATSDIQVNGDAGILAPSVLGRSGGFPTGGNPASPTILNTDVFNGVNRNDAITVIAHEIGHAIGFRHTDYMNRGFSCGSGGNEGDAGVGAIHIPGTPTRPSAGSWMLACSNGTDRPFTSIDRIALRELYGFKITGASAICHTNTSAFSVANVNTATTTWSASPAYLFTQATGTGNLASLQVTSSSYSRNAQVTFSINVNGNIVQVTKSFWVGKPKMTLDFNSVGSLIYINVVGLDNTDIHSQGITSVTWEEVARGGNCYSNVDAIWFSGLGYGNCNTWSIKMRITATNACGSTSILRTVAPVNYGDPDPDPCGIGIGFELTQMTENRYELRDIITPCRTTAPKKSVTSSTKVAIKVYDAANKLMLQSTGLSVDFSELRSGDYAIEATVDDRILRKNVTKK